MDNLLLVGGGGHCKSVIDVVESTGQWRIIGIVDNDVEQKNRFPAIPL